MRCKNCDGKISGTEVICPYCGWENEILADQERAREIAGVKERTRDFFDKPENAAHKTSYVMFRVIAAVLIVFVLATATTYCVNQLQSKDEYRDQQKSLSELEELYVSGDFEAMNTLLKSNPDFQNASFNKYIVIGRLYEQICWQEYTSPSAADFAARHPQEADSLDYNFKALFGLLGECAAMEEKGFVYGEKALIADYSQRAKALLKDFFLLTDEEILSGIDLSKDDKPDYTKLTDISIARLNGGTA